MKRFPAATAAIPSTTRPMCILSVGMGGLRQQSTCRRRTPTGKRYLLTSFLSGELRLRSVAPDREAARSDRVMRSFEFRHARAGATRIADALILRSSCHGPLG